MRLSKSYLSASTFVFWAWLLRPGETENASVQSSVRTEHMLAHPALEERLSELQRNARSVWRAVRVMVFLIAFAIVGLGYSTVFIPYWPQNMQQFLMFAPFKAHCALGLAALGCAGYFSVLGLRYSRELTCLRLQCQPVVSEIAEPAQGRIIPFPGTAEESELPQAA
jgi:hypothetical protein